MKNILMMMLGLGLTLGAIAGQPKLAATGKTGGGAPAKVVIVRSSYGYYPGLGYNPFYSSYFGYNAYYYSPYAFQQRPSKLDLQIDQITNDYHHDIAAARHNTMLSKEERKAKIRDLRHERENSIIEAKKGYYDRTEKDTE